MIPLNKKGEIDVKFLEKLPFDDFEEVIEQMSFHQIDYIFSLATPTNGPIKPLIKDYSLEDSYDWGWEIDIDKILERMREKVVKINQMKNIK